jgi:hypothetical protein
MSTKRLSLAVNQSMDPPMSYGYGVVVVIDGAPYSFAVRAAHPLGIVAVFTFGACEPLLQ